MIDKFFRWALFSVGIITSIFAGYMFYIDNIPAGAAWLAMAVGFLCFATRIKNDNNASNGESESNSGDKELHDLAVLIADIAVMSLKNIGRTIPPGTKEIEGLEDKLNNFLDLMPVEKSEREKINEEFNRLKNRNKSGRAIFNSIRN